MNTNRPRTRRTRLVLVAALATALGITVDRQHDTNVVEAASVVPETDFAIDGNPDGPNDFLAPYGPGTTSEGYATTGLYYDERIVDEGGATGCDLADDTTALGGVKLGDGPVWLTGGPNPNGKTDLDVIDIAAEKVDKAGEIFDIVYVGYQKCGGTGTWQTALYLDDGDGVAPSAGDADGDYLFVFDFNPNSGEVVFVQYQRVAGEWVLDTTDTSTFIDGYAAGDYGEVALNLTDLVFVATEGGLSCNSVRISGPAAAITGGDLNSQVKDLLGFGSIPIDNCGAVEVTKTAPAGVSSDDLFGYDITRGGGVVHDDTLAATGIAAPASTDEPTDGGSPDTTEISATITVGQTHRWDRVISGDGYDLTETLPTPAAGWAIDRIDCSYQDPFAAGNPVVDVTLYENGAPTGNTFTVPPYMVGTTALDPASCVITNVATGIVVAKQTLPGGSTTEFPFEVAGGGTTENLLLADDGSAFVALDAGTSVTITEGALADGWSLADIACVNGSDGQPATLTDETDTSVTLAVGGLDNTITCTFTNQRLPQLTLVKEVVTDNGGTADAGDWTLTATGPTTLEGPTGTSAQVPTGSYDLSESGGPAGYTASDWSCTGGQVDGDTVDLGYGDDVTCTITNDDDAPSLTLVKVVENDNGGSAVASDFVLSATGPTSISGAGGATSGAGFEAGTYDLSETGPSGYGASAWDCTGDGVQDGASITLGLGESATCTIVNDDLAPGLTLVKEVVNDNGGTADAADWTLIATGPTSFSGTTGVTSGDGFEAGTYTLSESGPGGYAAGDWSCEGGEQDGDTITVGLGETAVCTIVNDDIAPSLTLVKEIVNDDGGNASAADFTVSADGPTPIAGAGGATSGAGFEAGTYDLSESGPEGYTLASLTCDNAEGDVTQVSIGLGETVTCTFVNDDDPVDLELTKDDGGDTAVAGGDPIPYTITVQNVGTRDADLGEPITVTDVLPGYLSWNSYPASCSATGATLTCDIDPASMTVGAAPVVIETLVDVAPDAPSGSYVNRAWVDLEDDPVCEPAGECEPPPCEEAARNNNLDCEDTPVDRFATITIVKTDDVADGDTVIPGDDYSYTLVVTNNGPSTILPGLVVDDVLPVQLDLLSVDGGPSWTCDGGDAIECVYGPELAPGETAPTITVTVTVVPEAAGDVIDNVAVATGVVDDDCPLATVGATLSCNEVSDDDDESTPLRVDADLAIVKSATVSLTGPDGGFDWVLEVVNDGPGQAVNVVVGDIVPDSLTVTGVASSFFDCGNVGNTVTCTRPAMAVGASGTVTIAVTVNADSVDGSITNVATVESDTPDPDLSNNSDDATVDVVVPLSPTTTVPPTVVPQLPATGSGATGDLLRAAFLLVALGGTVVLVTRRRRTGDATG